jgi:RNA polymerase sigma-70 factor (ECF subfamily)
MPAARDSIGIASRWQRRSGSTAHYGLRARPGTANLPPTPGNGPHPIGFFRNVMNNSSNHPSNPAPEPDGAVAPGNPAAEPDDDFQLVSRAQNGDLNSYDALVTRHRARIFAMIRNMIHQEADAWDLTQEVFIKAWQALPRFEAKARFSTWLFRIAHNAVYDWTRKRRIESVGELNDEIFDRERIDPASFTTPAGGSAPDHTLAQGELRAKIAAALEKIPPDQREVVLLKDVQGLSYKEIATVMSCELGTVMSRLYYARQKLQTLLKDEYESR